MTLSHKYISSNLYQGTNFCCTSFLRVTPKSSALLVSQKTSSSITKLYSPKLNQTALVHQHPQLPHSTSVNLLGSVMLGKKHISATTRDAWLCTKHENELQQPFSEHLPTSGCIALPTVWLCALPGFSDPNFYIMSLEGKKKPKPHNILHTYLSSFFFFHF